MLNKMCLNEYVLKTSADFHFKSSQKSITVTRCGNRELKQLILKNAFLNPIFLDRRLNLG
jgi:hypothetical protein